MQDLPTRKHNRLEDYDYSQDGCYFITICMKGRQNILWDMHRVGANCVRQPLTKIGAIVENEITILSHMYSQCIVDKYVIMPNHVHMIIKISSAGGRTQFAPTISRVIKQFKGSVTKQIGYSIWQKSFYDHIIRDDADYLVKSNYIETNPARLADDEYYTINPSGYA